MYYVMYVSNGSLQVKEITEWGTPEQALVKFHDTCKILWNSQDVLKATVKILDVQLDVYQGYSETIIHEAQPEPEPEA